VLCLSLMMIRKYTATQGCRYLYRPRRSWVKTGTSPLLACRIGVFKKPWNPWGEKSVEKSWRGFPFRSLILCSAAGVGAVVALSLSLLQCPFVGGDGPM
jgi:hypothetical protein